MEHQHLDFRFPRGRFGLILLGNLKNNDFEISTLF